MENTIITPNVPSGWVAVWDEEYNEWFYVNESTGQSQWEPPMGTTFQGLINQPPPYSEPNVQHQRDSQQPTNCQQQQPPVVVTEPTHNRSKMRGMGGFLGGAVEALLLGDILAHETNDYGRGRLRRSRFRRNRFGRFGPGGYVPGVYGPNLFGPGVVVPGGFGPAGFGVGW